LGPANGSTISTPPTFSWTAAENARNYTLQVSQDPTFGNPIDDVTTDSTAYTSSSTYPADTVLYWRVRANDWALQGLNWSPTQTFVKTLPIPAPSSGNSTGGDGIPPLSWAPVQGAVSYNFHIDYPDGTSRDATTGSTSFTPVIWAGPGIWHWKVRANFPTSGYQTTTGGYSGMQTFNRTLAPPTGAQGVKVGRRLVISWNPDGAAKQYEVDVSMSDGFNTPVDSHRTYGTNWAPVVDLNNPAYRGQMYWRVAALDQAGNTGAFASGSFGAPKAACARAGRKHGKKHAAGCPRHRRRRKHK
jgi:hypothetical protein